MHKLKNNETSSMEDFSWELDYLDSVGSSFSLSDENDNDATEFLKEQLVKFEAALYEGNAEGLVGEAVEEYKLWTCFPHLRVIGKAIERSYWEGDESESDTLTEESSSDDTLTEQVDKWRSKSCYSVDRVVGKAVRLSPLPRVSRLTRASGAPTRYGTLPPIELLEVTPKPLIARSTSARLACRPATSKPAKPIVLSPICSRTSARHVHLSTSSIKDWE